MSHLLDQLLDPERIAACRAADDAAIRAQRTAAARCAPFWPFAPRTAAQERIGHPLPAERRRGPRASRFGALA